MRAMIMLVAVVAMAVAVAGCGDAGSPQERLTAAGDATSEEGSAAFTIQMDMSMGEDDGGDEASDSGRSAAMNMSMSGEGAIDFDEEFGRLTMEVPGLGMEMETIFDGDTTYTRMPAMFGGGSEGQWIRQEGGDLDATGLGVESGLGEDPADMLAALEDAADAEDIETLGSDEVRGDPVEGYAFTVRGADLGGSGEAPEGLADLEVPMEAWLDDQGRLRRMVSEIDISEAMDATMGQTEGADGDAGADLGALPGAMGGTMTMTMEMFDFGTEVDASVPDDADIIDADEFEQQMMEDLPGGEGMDEMMEGLPEDGEGLPEGMENLEDLEDLEDLDTEELEQQMQDLQESQS